MSDRESFFKTDAGKLAQYRQRERRRLLISLHDVEPQSKKMPEAEKDAFQRRILRELKDLGRANFRGPLALSVHLSTTKATAPQAQTVAKNLLDLLGKKRPAIRNPRKQLLYKDDSQIHALSVSCRHGEDRPMIMIAARPLGVLLADLELAAECLRKLEENSADVWHRRDQDHESIKSFRRLIKQELQERRRLGDRLYDAMVKMERWHAQRALLAQAAIRTAQIAWLFERPNNLVHASADRSLERCYSERGDPNSGRRTSDHAGRF